VQEPHHERCRQPHAPGVRLVKGRGGWEGVRGGGGGGDEQLTCTRAQVSSGISRPLHPPLTAAVCCLLSPVACHPRSFLPLAAGGNRRPERQRDRVGRAEGTVDAWSCRPRGPQRVPGVRTEGEARTG